MTLAGSVTGVSGPVTELGVAGCAVMARRASHVVGGRLHRVQQRDHADDHHRRDDDALSTAS